MTTYRKVSCDFIEGDLGELTEYNARLEALVRELVTEAKAHRPYRHPRRHDGSPAIPGFPRPPSPGFPRG